MERFLFKADDGTEISAAKWMPEELPEGSAWNKHLTCFISEC